MAKRISELDAAGNLVTGNELPVLQSGVTKRASFSTTPSAGKAMAWPTAPSGTFTPTLTFGGVSTGITYSTQYGIYQRVGNIIQYTAFISITNKGTATGAARIAGLPITSANVTGNLSSQTQRMNGVTYSGQIQSFINANSSVVELQNIPESGTSASLTDTNFSNLTSVMVSGFYFV